MVGKQKLTDAQVAALRAEYDPAIISARDIAKRYGVSKGYVHQIAVGSVRRSVGGKLTSLPASPRQGTTQ